MKSDYRLRAKKFLMSIYPYIKGCLTNPSDVEYCVDKYNVLKSRNVKYSYGSARIALMQSDYVVKWDYDEDAVHDIGGCKEEYNIYQEAQEEGFGYLLAETTLIEIEGITFSIMPRINNIGPCGHHGDISYYTTREEYEWLCTMGLNNDMHHYNWGTRYGKACIIDYACVNSTWFS